MLKPALMIGSVKANSPSRFQKLHNECSAENQSIQLAYFTRTHTLHSPLNVPIFFSECKPPTRSCELFRNKRVQRQCSWLVAAALIYLATPGFGKSYSIICCERAGRARKTKRDKQRSFGKIISC